MTGQWTVRGLGPAQLDLKAPVCERGAIELNGAAITGPDSAGAWLLQQWLAQNGAQATLKQWQPRWQALMNSIATREQIPAARSQLRTGGCGRACAT